MNKTISNAFHLSAVINGKTLFARIKTNGSVGFFQFYDKSTNTHTPSWEGKGPAFYAEVRDSEGTLYEAQNCVLHYIDKPIEFDSNGNSVAGTFAAGTFTKKSITIGKINCTVFQVVKEVFTSSGSPVNTDNDDFWITGNVVLPGAYTQDFQTETETLTIINAAAGGNMYYGKMDVTDIEGSMTEGTAVARLFSTQSGEWLDSGVTYSFFDYSGDNGAKRAIATSANFSVNGNTLKVNKDAVVGDDLIGCDMSVGGKVVFTAYGNMHDYTDPYYIDYDETGRKEDGSAFNHKIGHIFEGEVVKYTAKTVDGNGNPITVKNLELRFQVFKKNDGKLWEEKSTVGETSLSYDDVTKTAGGEVTGHVVGRIKL